MKAPGPRSKHTRPYRKSGSHGLERKLSAGGLSALDGRSAVARAVRDWRAAVAADLGGEDALSQAQRTLLDIAAQDVVLLTAADTWLREQAAGVINRRRRAFVPLVEQRLRVASHLTGLLQTLGLQRAVKPVPSLGEYLSQRSGALSGPADIEAGSRASVSPVVRQQAAKAASGPSPDAA